MKIGFYIFIISIFIIASAAYGARFCMQLSEHRETTPSLVINKGGKLWYGRLDDGSGSGCPAGQWCQDCNCHTSESCTLSITCPPGQQWVGSTAGMRFRPSGCNQSNGACLNDWGDCTGGDGSCEASTHTFSTIAADFPRIWTWDQAFRDANPRWGNQNVSFNAGWYNLTAVNIWPNFHVQATCSSTTGTANWTTGVFTTNSSITLPNPANGNTAFGSTERQCWCRLKQRSDGANGAWVFL